MESNQFYNEINVLTAIEWNQINMKLVFSNNKVVPTYLKDLKNI